VIVLILTPEEVATIRDALPPGALRDHIATYVPQGRRQQKTIPELVIYWPFHEVMESFWDAAIATEVRTAIDRIVTRWARPRGRRTA